MSREQLPVSPDATESEIVACPVCGARCADTPLYRYSAAQAATHFCSATRNADRHQRLLACIRRLWGRESSAVFRCGDCGFAFGHPHVGGDEEFYSILHEQKGYPRWKWDYELALKAGVADGAFSEVLDIGAGVGDFLRRLPRGIRRYAVEASDSNRADLAEAGIHVFPNLNAARQTHLARFTTITMFQVLEHIADFKPLLEQCRRLIAPAGRLVITVPDGEAMIRQEAVTGCADMPPNHINKFTPESLRRALHAAGFSVTELVPEPPSWTHALGTLHLRIQADAMKSGSIAAQVYRLRNRDLRKYALGLLAGPALLRMLPHLKQLRRGGAFGVVARPS